MSGNATGAISLHHGRAVAWLANFSPEGRNGSHQQAQPLAVMHLCSCQAENSLSRDAGNRLTGDRALLLIFQFLFTKVWTSFGRVV
jgi:hypothetical protein